MKRGGGVLVAAFVMLASASAGAQSPRAPQRGTGDAGIVSDGSVGRPSGTDGGMDGDVAPPAASDGGVREAGRSDAGPADHSRSDAGPRADGATAPGPNDTREDAASLEPPGRDAREEERERVAIMILSGRGVDPATADALTEAAIGAAAMRGHVSIVGKEEFQAQLDQDEARSLDCVTSIPCLGRAGVELGVDEAIAGTVGRRGSTKWVFNLNRIDIRTGELIGRAYREVEGDVGKVAGAIQDAIPRLYEPKRDPGALHVTANVRGAEVVLDGVVVGIYRGGPVRVHSVSPGEHELEVRAPQRRPWKRTVDVEAGSTMHIEANLAAREPKRVQTQRGAGGPRISPLVWIGGGVSAASAIAALGFGVSSQRTPGKDATRAQAVAFFDDRKRDARAAHVAMALAAAGAGVLGVGLWMSELWGRSSPREDETQTRAAAVPVRGGAVFQMQGHFP